MPRWLQRILSATITGITLPPFGIYLRPGHEGNQRLQRHEAVHWEQYERMGLVRFYATYLWQRLQYGKKNHPMEIEARNRSGAA